MDEPVSQAGCLPHLEELGSLIHELSLNFVREGVKDRDDLVKKVNGVLKDIFPEVTERHTADAISGYGNYRPLGKDPAQAQLRDLKGQLQQVSKLQDMEAGRAPLKTGVEKRTPSDEERRLQKQVAEAKKKSGFTATDPARQLKSALDSIKTNLRNQISDLEKQITSREKIVKSKTASPKDTESEALKAKRDELKKQYDEIFNPPKSDEEKFQADLDQKTKTTEKQVAEIQKKIKANDIAPSGKKPLGPPNSPKLVEAQGKLSELQKQLADMRKAAKPKPTDEEVHQKALDRAVKAAQTQLEEYQDRIKRGDLSGAKKKPLGPPNSPELVAAQAKVEEARARLQEMKDLANPKKTPEERQQSAYKTRVAKRIADLQDRISRGDFSKPAPKTPITPDEEGAKLREQVDRLKQQYDQDNEKAQLANRGDFEKAQDAAVSWSRSAKLLSFKVYPKLLAAALVRGVSEPISRVLSLPLKYISPDIYRKAEAEIGFNAIAEAKAIVHGLSSIGKAWEKARTGKTNIDVIRGRGGKDPEMSSFIGNTHGAMKEPIRQTAFKRAQILLYAQAARNGLNVHDPVVIASIESAAAEQADRQIFKGESPFTKYLVRLPIGAIRNADFVGAKTMANTLEFLSPIVTVPTNIAVHTARLNPLIGFGEAALRYAVAARRGELANSAEGLSTQNAELIAKAAKIGAAGLLLSAYAWINPDKFGGVWEEGRKKNGLPTGDMDLFGMKVPHWLSEAPELKWLQIVASARRVHDRYVRTEGQANAAEEALAFVTMAPVKNFPFVDTYIRLFDENKSFGRTAAAYLRDAVVPSALTSTLSALDPVKRSPKTPTQELEMAVPGFRNNVPASKNQRR